MSSSLISLHLQSLASAIAATKVLSAQQVVKNEAGEEVSEYQVHWWNKLKNGGSSHCNSNTIIFSLHVFLRFWSPWTHQGWRCSKTRLYQTTFQKKRRAQRGSLTEQFPAPQLRKIPVEAGSMLLPVSSQKPSTGETGAVLFWDSVSQSCA